MATYAASRKPDMVHVAQEFSPFSKKVNYTLGLGLKYNEYSRNNWHIDLRMNKGVLSVSFAVLWAFVNHVPSARFTELQIRPYIWYKFCFCNCMAPRAW